MRRSVRTKWMLIVGAFCCASIAGQSFPQEVKVNYWIPRVKVEGTKKTFIYDVKVPDFFVPYLKVQTARGGGVRMVKKINGKDYLTFKQDFSWDVDTQNPDHGIIRIDDKVIRYQSSDLFKHDKPDDYTKEFKDAITALSKPAEGNPTWRELDLLAVEYPAPNPPGLVYAESTQAKDKPAGGQATDNREVAAAKNTIKELATTTVKGQYYDVQIPVELDKFREQVLAIGNSGRRDPDFRKNHLYYKGNALVKPTDAVDLSGDEVTDFNELTKRTDTLVLKKQRTSPPYFDDLKLNDQLNEAAQFHAEYQAKMKQQGHEGPQSYDGHSNKVRKDVSMEKIEHRVKSFGYTAGIDMEGAGGPAPPDWAPEWWMASDTHFRPWFNVGNEVTEMGFGVAKGEDGGWYFCVLMGLGK